jgi:N-acetylneuraminic acid mutarotase
MNTALNQIVIALTLVIVSLPARALTFTNVASMNIARDGQTATLLFNGKVLAAGGFSGSLNYLSSAELFDPANGIWTNTCSLSTTRSGHTATLLPNGRVLVVGGHSGSVLSSTVLASTELFDPASGTWTATGSLHNGRYGHTATLLPNGRVLVAGGYSGSAYLTNAEIYDPAVGTWATTGSLQTGREYQTATLLSNGKVLVAGGNNGAVLSSGELFDPANGTWTTTGSLNASRYSHTATLLPNGKVLVAGGYTSGSAKLASAELYDPTTAAWTPTTPLGTARTLHTATLLPNGQVQVVAGLGSSGAIASTELYDPVSATWTVGSLNVTRYSHSATLLPSGDLLIAGGYNTAGLTNAEDGYSSGSWTTNAPMNSARSYHTTTLLPNGIVLVAGGQGTSVYSTVSAELYNPGSRTWTMTGPMTAARAAHSATLLPNGKVLVAGGTEAVGAEGISTLASAELYDPASGTWVKTGSLNAGRYSHTATLLVNGKVLVTGGYDTSFNPTPLASAELYDPAAGTWTIVNSMSTNRASHVATRLSNGKVLVAGGQSINSILASSELFDPASGTWANTGSMNVNYYGGFTSTLLPNGKVLINGGFQYPELYDPVSGTWTTVLVPAEVNQNTATLLTSGKVLVEGTYTMNIGYGYLYDPASGAWVQTGPIPTNLLFSAQTATLLTNGQVLVTGGYDTNYHSHADTWIFDSGLGYSNSWQPQVTSISSPLTLGSSLAVTGAQFRGLSEASGGNNAQDSSTDYPLLQLHSLANEQTMLLATTNWSNNSFVSTPVTNFPLGYALATVFVNGIPSPSSIIFINPALNAIVLTHSTMLGNGTFQSSFTNLPTFGFSVLASTNLTVPAANWTVLSGATEISPGQYQFTDPQATNYPNLFYRVRWP